MATTEAVDILLVDDQPSRLLTYEAILAPLGHRFVTATSGVEALQKLMEREFAVILLDVSMPDMVGFETARMIHGHPRFESTPIIFVTGIHLSELDRLKGYEVGAVDSIVDVVATAVGLEELNVERVHVSVLATEQCADKQPWEPLGRGLPSSKVGRFQLRPRCEQIGAAFEELGRLSWLDVRNGRGAAPGLHHRRIGGLTPDQHGDSVSRGSGERPERRYRCARARRVRAGAFDVEAGREPDTLPGSYEAKRLVLGSRDRTYRFELLECANEREVVGRDITQYQQAHTPCLVFSRHFVRRGSSCT